MATNFIGGSVLRLEDPTLIRGRGRFAADINFPHQLHMRVVRSTRAHGKILSIDTSRALAHPGVMAVWTSADVRNVPPINLREGRIEHLNRTTSRYWRKTTFDTFYRHPFYREPQLQLRFKQSCYAFAKFDCVTDWPSLSVYVRERR